MLRGDIVVVAKFEIPQTLFGVECKNVMAELCVRAQLIVVKIGS